MIYALACTIDIYVYSAWVVSLGSSGIETWEAVILEVDDTITLIPHNRNKDQ